MGRNQGIASLPFGWGPVTREPEEPKKWTKWGKKNIIYYQKVKQHWTKKNWKPEQYGAPSYEAWLDATGFDGKFIHGGGEFQKLLHFLLVAHEGGGSVQDIMADDPDYKTDYVAAVIDLVDAGKSDWPAVLLSNPTAKETKRWIAAMEDVLGTPLPAATSRNSAVVEFGKEEGQWKKGGPVLANNSMGTRKWACSTHVPFRTIPDTFGPPWDERDQGTLSSTDTSVAAWNSADTHQNGHVNNLTYVPWSKIAFINAAGIASRGPNGLKNQSGVNAVAESQKKGKENCYYMPSDKNKLGTQPYPHKGAPCIPIDMRLCSFFGLYYYPGCEDSRGLPNPRYFASTAGTKLIVQEPCNKKAHAAVKLFSKHVQNFITAAQQQDGRGGGRGRGRGRGPGRAGQDTDTKLYNLYKDFYGKDYDDSLQGLNGDSLDLVAATQNALVDQFEAGKCYLGPYWDHGTTGQDRFGGIELPAFDRAQLTPRGLLWGNMWADTSDDTSDFKKTMLTFTWTGSQNTEDKVILEHFRPDSNDLWQPFRFAPNGVANPTNRGNGFLTGIEPAWSGRGPQPWQICARLKNTFGKGVFHHEKWQYGGKVGHLHFGFRGVLHKTQERHLDWPTVRPGMDLDVTARELLQRPDAPPAFWTAQKNPVPLPMQERNVVDLEILFDFGDNTAGKRRVTSSGAGPSNAPVDVSEDGQSDEGDFDGDELVNAGIEVDEEEDQTVEEEQGDGEERVELQDDGVGRGELADPKNDEEFAGKKERGKPEKQLFPVWTDDPVSLRELYPDPVSDGGWYGELDMGVWNRSIFHKDSARLLRRIVMTWLYWAMKSDENKGVTMKMRGCKLELKHVADAMDSGLWIRKGKDGFEDSTNYLTHHAKDGHLHVCKPVANFGPLAKKIAKGWKLTKMLDAAKLEWITHSKDEPATSTDLAAQRQFGEALDAGRAEWSVALDAAVELVRTAKPRGEFTVGDWVQSPWHYNHLGFHETESLFSSGERFRQGCKRCCRPFYERQWILYPPDVWSTNKDGKSVKEAKATYHQRWWYARADPPSYPGNWIAPLKLDDLFNEAWGKELDPEDESKWEAAIDVPAGVEPSRSAPKWTRTTQKKEPQEVREGAQQKFVATRQAQYIDNLGVRNEDEGYTDPELAKHFRVVWDNNLTATGTGALIPATVALDKLKETESLGELDMDKRPAGGTVTYRAYWNEGYTDGSQIAIRQGRLGGGRAVRFGMEGYRLERYNKYSNVCQDCKAVLATRKRWAPSLPRPVKGGVIGMGASEKEHNSALERAVERMKRAAAAKKAQQPEQKHEPHGWTTGAVRDFEEFQKGPLTLNKYARSGGPTVVTQDLTEALGRLTVIKDKAGDVTLALKAVQRVLGMPSDEPPWTDLDPLEQGARKSAFRKALEEMRRFLENKKQLLINGPSRTSAVDPEETRLELRDEPPYVWCEECSAIVEDDNGRLTRTAQGEWRGSLVVFERFEYSPRQKKLAFDAIEAGSDESVWKDVMQGVRRRLHLPDAEDGDAEVWQLDAEDGEEDDVPWEERADKWVRVMVKTTATDGGTVPLVSGWKGDKLVALTRDSDYTPETNPEENVMGGERWPRGKFREFVPQMKNKTKATIARPWRQERIRHQSRFWITYVLHRPCRLVREGEDRDDAPGQGEGSEAEAVMKQMGRAVHYLFSNEDLLASMCVFGKALREAPREDQDLVGKYRWEVLVGTKKEEKLVRFYGHSSFRPQMNSYLDDDYFSHIQNVECDCGVEVGPQRHHPHFHMLLTFDHFTYLHFDYKLMSSYLELMFKGVDPDPDRYGWGDRFVLRTVPGGELFYTDNERPYVHFKLAPSDNYSQIIAGYIRKDAATVLKLGGDADGRHAIQARADMGL